MIRQLLNRQFVLDQLEAVKKELQRVASDRATRRRSLPPGGEALDKEDYKDASALLEEARQAEEKSSSGQAGFEPGRPVRRGEAVAQMDDVCFISRNPAISNLQSALDQYFQERQPEAIRTARPALRRSHARQDDPVTDRELNGVGVRRAPPGRRLFNQFSVTDVGWLSSLTAQGIRGFRKRYPFRAQSATPRPIADRVRLIIVGDWASGLPRAQKVSREIARVLAIGEREGIQQHVIHLGDTYYSGWEQEYRGRFIPYWPVREEQKDNISSWSLNGNHDMYSGGHAYYGTLLKDPRFAGQEGSSFFSLQNRHWRILGLDTAWEDGALKDPQPSWVRQQANEAKRAGQRVMLLSHHQLFSVFENGNAPLASALKAPLDQGLVDSWIWGHEHRCVLYGPHGGLQFSACLGHGGIPVYMTHKDGAPLPAPAIYEYRARIKTGLESWALFGFGVLDLIDGRPHLQLIDENGREHHSQPPEAWGAGTTLLPTPSPVPSAPSGGMGPWQGLFQTTLVTPPPPPPPRRAGVGVGRPASARAARKPRVLRTKDDAARPAIVSRADMRVQRTPHMDIFPEPPVKPSSQFNVLVYADTDAARPGEKSQAIEITFPPEVDSVRLSARLSVTDHFRIISAPIQELVLERDQARSTSAHYDVRTQPPEELAAVPGAPAITASFTYRGRASGLVHREIRIAGFKPQKVVERTAPWRALSGARVEVDTAASEPDLTIEILDPHKDGQHFDCTVRSPHLEGYRSGRAGRWDLPKQSGDLVHDYFTKFTSDPASARKTMLTLTGAGLELFDAAPAVFQEAFWALVDQKKPLRTIYIVSQEAFIPWELMVPNRPVQGRPRQERESPLGVEFAMGRWIKEDFLSPRQRLPLSDGKAIAPNYPGSQKLTHAAKEVAFLSERFQLQKVTPATVDGIETEFARRGGASFLHFACHGDAGGDEQIGMAIRLEGDDESLDATMLRGMKAAKKAFQATPAFVFMNACEVGRQQPALIGVGGLAPTFLLIGAGAVLAPLWSVKDTIAFEVAKEFYRMTKESPRTPFAEIMRAIRGRAYRSPYEDSWAAYSFYGDPLAAQIES